LLGVPLFVLMQWGSCDFILCIVCDVHTLSYSRFNKSGESLEITLAGNYVLDDNRGTVYTFSP
jgi:hypothetical protein